MGNNAIIFLVVLCTEALRRMESERVVVAVIHQAVMGVVAWFGFVVGNKTDGTQEDLWLMGFFSPPKFVGEAASFVFRGKEGKGGIHRE